MELYNTMNEYGQESWMLELINSLCEGRWYVSIELVDIL